MPNSKSNQKCWNCAHFQLYDQSETPQSAWGDCRQKPKVGRAEDPPTLWNQYWPFVEDATDFWCAQWKRTTLTPPTEPTNLPQTNWPAPWVAFQAAPWNVRAPMNISCWNCNHYQRDVDPPVDPGDNTGECRKHPMPPVLDLVVGVTEETLAGLKFSYVGSSYWCSCWERAEGTVPVDPGPAQ